MKTSYYNTDLRTFLISFQYRITCKNFIFQSGAELLEILKLHGYKLDESDYFNEILRIEKQSKTINIKVDELKRQLPKSEVQTNVDEVILSYCMIAGLTFDTNQITVAQFYGLQNLVNDKIKRLENGK